MQIHYGSSTALPICLDILAAFENANERKYRSDFKQFLLESKMEDFFRAESGTVMVSTMHKAKGREFDHVYILLAEHPTTTDEERRKLYVGMTRAKETLYIPKPPPRSWGCSSSSMSKGKPSSSLPMIWALHSSVTASLRSVMD